MRKPGQSTIEFTFTLVAVVLLAYGLIRIFRWAGIDLAERRWAHEQVFYNADNGNPDPNYWAQYGVTTIDNMDLQLTPDFYRPKRVNAVNRKWQ